MNGQELLDILEYIHPELIEEAEKSFPQKKAKWLKLAAAFLVVVGLGSFFGIRYAAYHNPGSESAAIGQSSQASSPDISDVGKKSALPAAEAPAAQEGCYPASETAEMLLSMELGGIRLGMSEENALAVLGEPTDCPNSGVVTFADGSSHISWFYKFSDDPERLYDVSLGMIDIGDGWIVNEISAFSSSDFVLSNGIRIGSSRAEVEACCSTFTVSEQDGGSDGGIHYSLQENQLALNIVVSEDRVTFISLGSYIPYDLDLDADSPNEGPYSFFGDPISIYEKTDSGWFGTVRGGMDAKHLETLMGIEELRPYDGTQNEVRYVIDFHNGTVAVLYGADDSGAVYTTENFTPEQLDTENWQEGLTLYTECYFPEGTWDAVARD